MRKFLSIGLSLALMTFQLISANFYVEKKEVPEIIDTEELSYTLTDEDFSQLYTCRQDVRKETTLEVSYEDARLLLCISRAEGGPTLEGQLWSMRTILNRQKDDRFPDTVWNIVSDNGQFEVFTSGAYINADVNTESHLALAMIEKGWDETKGAVYWRTNAGSKDSWHERNLEYIDTIDGNNYYK